MEYFSNWTEAYLVPNQEALNIAKMCHLGISVKMNCGQGRNSELEFFKKHFHFDGMYE